MKIVFLDAKSIGEDIDLSAYDALGEVVKYGFSTPEEVLERVKDADVLEKAKAATVYCEATSTWNADHAGKPWHYALVSHDEVRINSGFKYLMENRVPPEQLHFEL